MGRPLRFIPGDSPGGTKRSSLRSAPILRIHPIQSLLHHAHRIPVAGLRPAQAYFHIRTDFRPGFKQQVPFFQQQPAGHVLHSTNYFPDLAFGLHQAVNLRVDRLVETKREIREVISRVEDVTCRLLLEKRNLLFETWPKICEDMKMGLRWAQTRHRDAVGMVQEVLDRMYPEY